MINQINAEKRKGFKMAKLSYLRVSSTQQNEARQREAMKHLGIDREFVDKASGKNTERKALQEMIDYAREGDIVYILDFSRLARSTQDLLNIIQTLNKKGVQVVSIKEQLDTSTPTGKLMLTFIGAINEFQREIINENAREGIAIAKAEGKYKGGQPKKIDETLFQVCYSRYTKREINKIQFAETLNVSRPTLDKLLKEREGKE